MIISTSTCCIGRRSSIEVCLILLFLFLSYKFAGLVDGKPKTLRPDEHPNYVDTYKEMEKLLNTGKQIQLNL